MKFRAIIFFVFIMIGLCYSSCQNYKVVNNSTPEPKRIYKDSIIPTPPNEVRIVELPKAKSTSQDNQNTITKPKTQDVVAIKITDYNKPSVKIDIEIVKDTTNEVIPQPVQKEIIAKIETQTETEIAKPIDKLIAQKEPIETESELAPAEQKWRPYYFPVLDLKEPKAYQYIAKGQYPDTTYRLMRTMELAGESFLITEEYNHLFQIKSIKKEKINGNGVFVEKYSSYETGSFGESDMINCSIIKEDYINWAMDRNTPSSVQFHFNSKLFPSYDITINKKIELLNEEETVLYEGKELKAITIKDAEVTIFTNHKNISEERYKLEYINQYAEGIGLVRYALQMVNHPTERPRTYELSNVLNYSEWNNLVGFKSN